MRSSRLNMKEKVCSRVGGSELQGLLHEYGLDFLLDCVASRRAAPWLGWSLLCKLSGWGCVSNRWLNGEDGRDKRSQWQEVRVLGIVRGASL